MTLFKDVTFGDDLMVILGLRTELECLRGLLDNNRKGLISMTKENHVLHEEVDSLKAENEALTRLLDVSK